MRQPQKRLTVEDLRFAASFLQTHLEASDWSEAEDRECAGVIERLKAEASRRETKSKRVDRVP